MDSVCNYLLYLGPAMAVYMNYISTHLHTKPEIIVVIGWVACEKLTVSETMNRNGARTD